MGGGAPRGEGNPGLLRLRVGEHRKRGGSSGDCHGERESGKSGWRGERGGEAAATCRRLIREVGRELFFDFHFMCIGGRFLHEGPTVSFISTKK